MSLINQMLQDLDARRSEVTGNDALGQQIRAVPPRRGVHPAWWACLALALVSAGIIGWLLLRPVAPSAAGVNLPLRLDAHIPAVRPQPGIADGATSEGAATPGAQLTPQAVPPTVPPPPEPPSSPSHQAVAPGETAPAKPAPPVAPRSVPQPAPAVEARSEATQQSERQSAVSRLTSEHAPQAFVGTKQVKELTPQQRAENEYRKAVVLIQQGRGTEAVSFLEQALQLDARHVGARQALIGIMLDAGRRDEAWRQAKLGLDMDPSQTGLAMISARLQLERGDLPQAIETLEKTLPHASEQPEYLAFLAALQQRAEHHKQAVDLYVKALQRSPQNGLWWMGMAISLQADQRKSEAAEAFRRARASGSLSPELQAFVDSRLAQLR